MEDNPYQAPRTLEPDEVIVALPVVDNARCCDQCGGEQFVTWNWWHPLLLHWIINPGLGFNELVLGQRVPAQLQCCRQCLVGNWLTQSTYVVCPHCQGVHRSDLWDLGSYGKLQGVVCPDCGCCIPSVRNLVALAVTMVLMPIWWPLSLWFGPHYQRWCQRRAQQGRRRSFARRPAQRQGLPATLPEQETL